MQPRPGIPFYEWLAENNYLTDGGDVSYPHLSNEELAYWRFKAYRMIYFNPDFLKHVLGFTLNELSEILRMLKMGFRALPTVLKGIRD